MLVDRRPKVGNYVSSCCAGKNLLLHCVPQHFEHEYTRATNVWLNPALLVTRVTQITT